MGKSNYVFIISLSRLKHGVNQWFPFISCRSIMEAKKLFQEKYGISTVEDADMTIFPDECLKYWSIRTTKGNKHGLITRVPQTKEKK